MRQLLGIQMAHARRVNINGRAVLTAIHKQAVTGPVAVQRLGLVGDAQADLSVHGGLDKAVYAYPSEHYPFWQDQRAAAGLCGIDDAAARTLLQIQRCHGLQHGGQVDGAAGLLRFLPHGGGTRHAAGRGIV